MKNEQEPLITQEEEKGINLEDFAYLLLSHWQWIAAAVILALALAVFHIKRTTPTYTRSMQLLIKDEGNGKSAAQSLAQDFQNLGIVQSFSNINNEIITISAPALMEEVVKRAHADVQMSCKEGLHTVPVYDESPITILLPETADDAYVSFKMKLKKDKTAELTEFNIDGEETGKTLNVKLNQLARTPFGPLYIQTTKFWKEHFISQEIEVTKYPLEYIARAYSGALAVELADKESSILNLTLTDDSKQRADDLLNKIVAVYNERWLKDKNLVAESTSEFITKRLEDLSKELGDVDQQISDYKSSTMLPDIEAAASLYMNQSQKNTEELLDLNNQKSLAKYLRDYLADNTNKEHYIPTNTGIGSTGIEQMITGYNKTVNLRNEVLTNSNATTPLALKYEADLELQKQSILRSLDNLIAQIQSQISAWQATEDETNEKLATAPKQVKQLLSVGRQQKVKEALYIYLLKKREENELSKSYIAWNTRIIQPPTGSNRPSAPRRNTILAIAFAIGLCIPIGLLYLRETLNHTIRGRADLEGMNTPLIGEIPSISKKEHWWKRKQKNAERKVYIQENSRDIINETFRILRTKLDYVINSNGADKNVVMLTSFNAGSGKSFISGNLIKVFSLKNKRVIGVDLDLRHGSLSNIAGHPHHGISDYLSGVTDDIDSLIMHNACGENCDVLPVGIFPPNPAELLQNGRIKEVLDYLREQYDYVFLDCPPVEIVADTNIIRDQADVTLFVVRAGLLDRRNLRYVDQLYLDKTYNNMNIILNGTEYVSGRYGTYRYGYSYGYGKGYGYGYGNGYINDQNKPTSSGKKF